MMKRLDGSSASMNAASETATPIVHGLTFGCHVACSVVRAPAMLIAPSRLARRTIPAPTFPLH
jgi:hypothetical protein